MNEPKRGRGRPKGSKNKRPERAGVGVAVGALDGGQRGPSSAAELAPARALGTQRESLEADRDRLLKGIAECTVTGPDGTVTAWDTVAKLQTQLNGVNRMLLRISGESAPSDANLIKSPQWSRLKAKLFDCLSKKHPAAWAAVLEIEREG